VAVGPDDPSLKRVCGVQGLLLEGLGERTEDHIVTVTMASIKHAARLADDAHEEKSTALAASGGTFRFVEMRFRDVVDARRRALLLYLCTFNAQRHTVVPVLSRPMLHDSNICYGILQLWDLYCLTWPSGDRAAPYQLKLRGQKMQAEAVPICGNQSMRHTMKQGEWQSGENGMATNILVERDARRAEATRQRYNVFAKKYSDRRKREVGKLQASLQATSIDRLADGQAHGACEVSVTGALPPTTAMRIQEAPAACMHADKAAAKTLITLATDAEATRLRQSRDAVLESRGVAHGRLGFEDKLMAFHTQREAELRSKRMEDKRASLESKKESARSHQLELAHKRAERDIMNKHDLLQKRLDAQISFNPHAGQHIRDRDESEKHKLVQERRAHVASQKAKREQSKDLLRKLSENKFWISRACFEFDKAQVRKENLAAKQKNVLQKRETWAHTTAALAEKHHVHLEYQHRQIMDMRHQLEHLMELRRESEEEHLQQLRSSAKAQKSFDTLFKCARQEMELFNQGSSTLDTATLGSYERTLQAFRDLAEHVGQSVLEARGRMPFPSDADDIAGVAPSSDATDEGTSFEPGLHNWPSVSSLPRMEDSEVSPADVDQAISDVIEARGLKRPPLLLKSMGARPPDMPLLPSRRPDVEPPKPSPMLPRRGDQKDARLDSPSESCNAGLFLPEEQLDTRATNDHPPPSRLGMLRGGAPRAGHLTTAELEVETGMGLYAKKPSEGKMSTVTTMLSSSATGSLATLTSSQTSLPQALPVLPPRPSVLPKSSPRAPLCLDIDKATAPLGIDMSALRGVESGAEHRQHRPRPVPLSAR